VNLEQAPAFGPGSREVHFAQAPFSGKDKITKEGFVPAMRQVLIPISVISFLLISGLAHGEIYKWVDPKGNLHFTNMYRTVPETYRENVESRIWVKQVIDVNTLLLRSGEQVELTGVKTSRTRGFRNPAGAYMKEATLFVKQLVEGKEIRLEFDWENRDRYGRLLAYVYLLDGTFVNEEIIKQGYGLTDTIYPFKYMEEFRGYESDARENKKGLWRNEWINKR
jgi:micrococcal nuclease